MVALSPSPLRRLDSSFGDLGKLVPISAWERLTRLAARLLRAPIAFAISRTGGQPHLHAQFGVPGRDLSREIFAAMQLASDDQFEANDLPPDAGPAEKAIRSLAGVTLRSPDQAKLGVLAVADFEPRRLTEADWESLRDVAALVANEAQLHLALLRERQHVAALDCLGAGVVITDPNLASHPLVYVNPGFTATTAYTAEEVLGKNCRFLQGPDTSPEHVASVAQAIRERRGIVQEILNYRKDGTPFWNELTITPVFDDAGQIINFVGLQMDITARKQLDQLRDDLTHMLIHDLRSPLSGTMGALNLLQEVSELNARDLELISIAAEGAGMVNEMITTLLDVNRLEVGRMPLRYEAIKLEELIRDALQPFAMPAGQRRVTSIVPDPGAACTCDAELIRRTLINLVGNALKFSPPGAEVRVIASEVNGAVEIAVADEGEGISPEDCERIFEKFGQVEGRRNRHSTGLGLTFCKLAVEAHGGQISVSSRLGKGSVFRVRLPKKD